MARADERVHEHLARQAQTRVEAEASAAPRPGGVSSSSGGVAPARAAPAQGEQGELAGQAEPAFAGVRPATEEV
eukprot:8421440-Alexandrium_andersonii.AAC.1